MRAVGHFRGHLHAAVHRSRMQYQQPFPGAPQTIVRQPVLHRVLPHRREERPALALELNPQQVEDVGLLDHLVQIVGHRRAERFDAARNETRRPAHRHPRAELAQAPQVGARHPRVQDVAHQADVQVLQLPLLADGEDVQQPLGRMLVDAVAGVDHAGVQLARQQLGRAGRGVAHHHRVHLHRLDVPGRIDQALALLHAGGGALEVDRIRGQPLGGQLEAGAGPGRGLEEQVGDGLAAQRRHLLDGARRHALELLGGIEQQFDLAAAEQFQRQQVLARPGGRRGRRLSAGGRRQ